MKRRRADIWYIKVKLYFLKQCAFTLILEKKKACGCAFLGKPIRLHAFYPLAVTVFSQMFFKVRG